MAPLASTISCRLCLLSLAAFELLGVHSWPSWLQAPLSGPRVSSSTSAENSVESSAPEALLLRQLRNVDVAREPEVARTLHVAIANVLRSEGTSSSRTLQHLLAAREAAERTDDSDTILTARIELAEAYTDAGRPQDAERELDTKKTYPLLSPENFWQYGAKLDRASARANFELGSFQVALESFEEAARMAVQPEDIVRSTCDAAMAHACLGHAQKSLEPLRKVMHVLEASRKSETMPVASHKELAVEVQFRLGEAYHSMGDFASAKKHYERVSKTFTTRSALAVKTNLRNIGNGAGPALRCPGGAKTQRFQLPTHGDASKTVNAKVASLLAAHEYKKAEYELWHFLETQRQPYKSVDATTTLISLGNIYISQERRSYLKAAHCFRKALQASLSCCGARSQEAKAAFKGLSFVQDMIPTKERSQVESAIQEYLSAADKFGASAGDLGRKHKVAPVVTV